MKRLALMLSLSAAALLGGCDDDTTEADMGAPDLSATPRDMTGGGGDAGSEFPAAPTLGTTQIDRMGRAGVNTALTNPFYDPGVAQQKTAHEMAQDDYNVTPRAMWSKFAAQFANALAVYDAIDGTCGNQALSANAAVDGGAAASYGTLAGVLTDDELYVDTRPATCDGAGNYLAVEVGFITKQAPATCGGRTPLDDVIDVTYSVVAGLGAAVTDGTNVTADGDTANKANNTTFPFLGAPN